MNTEFYPAYSLTGAEKAKALVLITKHSVKHGDCMIWKLSRTHGYGNIYMAPRVVRAHRLSYAANHGLIPAGSVVMHSCDNRACVNPAHLSLGTQAENLKACRGRGRNWHSINPSEAARIGRKFALLRHYGRKIPKEAST